MVKRLLRRIGLVPLAKYQKLSSDLAIWQTRTKKFSDETERLKVEVRSRETTIGALNKELRESRRQTQEAAERLEKLKRDIEKKVVAKQQRDESVTELQRKLAGAEHDLATARESLMAVEVKLDILEGAANVLDVRTRNGMTTTSREPVAKASTS
jgi:chromosome segregation ATPase